MPETKIDDVAPASSNPGPGMDKTMMTWQRYHSGGFGSIQTGECLAQLASFLRQASWRRCPSSWVWKAERQVAGGGALRRKGREGVIPEKSMMLEETENA